MAFSLSLIGNEQQLDSNGAPLSGGLLYTYVAGSTTPAPTYTDSTGGTPQANPIVLNSLGRPASPIWLADGSSYKFVLTTSTGVAQWTIDEVTGVSSSTPVQDEWVLQSSTPTYINATQFSIAGDQTSTYTVGRRVRTVNTGGVYYGYISASVFGSVTTVTVVLDSGSLDAGLSAASVGLLNADNLSIPAQSVVNSGQIAGFRNKIHNGIFTVNQRAVSGSVVLSSGAYGHDRWKAGASGCSYTFAETDGVTTLTISAGSLQQVIEADDIFTGTYVMSWAGTAQGKIGAGSYSASGVVAAATGGASLTVEFNTGTLSRVQLEPGTKPSSFEHRPYQTEKGLCRHFYRNSFPEGTAPAQNAGATGSFRFSQNVAAAAPQRGIFIQLSPPMRPGTFTVTTYNPSAANANARNVTRSNDPAVTGVAGQENGIALTATASAGSAAGDDCAIHWQISNEP